MLVFKTMDKQEQFAQIVAKIQELKSGKNPLDLSSKEDLAVGIMNLISLEEHFFFTYNKTNDAKYLELLNQTREIRKNLLKEIVKNPEGEVWCISKHLLAVTMRLMEVGTKKLADGEKEKAQDLFDKSYIFWNIFWGLNLGLIDVKDLPNREDSKEKEMIHLVNEQKKDDNLNNNQTQTNQKNKKPLNVWSKLGEMIQEVLDCCKE